ncbi:MAG: translation initiation factor IF-2, partial [Bacteroidaceae bacterium]|nr:translation initiation factor IF-2 [Bacteroidaceae bacterium]
EEERRPQPEVFRQVKPQTIEGPKVLGSIDLSSINETTRPKKKSKEERKKEREEKMRQQQAATAGKKKRNRIQPNKVDVNAEAKKVMDDGRQGADGSKGSAGGGRGKRKGGNLLNKNNISDEEVAKEVKKTLARLQSKKAFASGAKYRREKRDQIREQMEQQATEEANESKTLKLTEFVTANELASMMNVPVTKVISTCMSIGMMISINQRMDAETINMVAEEFGFKTEYVSASVSKAVHEEEDEAEDLEPRDPIVTVMGHVDHGKTSLLDWIRKSNVIAGEAGGITQHIGAYNVTLENGRHITFLDTPGHEAFTAMRARGAQATDIAIIIIAADDDVMPQTKEAISHAQAAGVPMVFAINKIDKPGADPEKVKGSLANMNLLVEDWGGKYQSQDISAKKGIGVNDLLEKVLLEADMLELKANPNRKGTGTIIESSLDKGRGYVATILVSNGTLNIGDHVIAGTCYGRVKDLTDERGRKIKSVGPSRAATLLGLNGAPQAGDTFHVMDSEQEVRDIANKRLQLQREQGIRTQHRIGLEEIGARIAMGGVEELNIIVKGDVDGSVEALSDSLINLSTEKIQVNVIHKAVGQISENDIVLAAASNAIIIGFQVRPSKGARTEAEKQGVDIRLYSVIYDAIEEVKEAMEGLLKPIVKEEVTALVEVRQVYRISKVGLVAGAYVVDGKVSRTNKARLIRDGIVIFTGEINALKRFKDDVKEVSTNFECGISLTNCNDIREGDTIETYQEIEVRQKL